MENCAGFVNAQVDEGVFHNKVNHFRLLNIKMFTVLGSIFNCGDFVN